MTNKINRILAPVDFSEASLNAVETAASLAVKCGAALYMLYAHDNILDFIGFNTATVKSVDNNSSSVLAAIASEVGQKYGIKPGILEHESQPNEAIIKTVADYRCDLVVMGSSGASGFRKGHIGTTAYQIIKYGVCPVLLVPAGKKITSFRKPLYPVRPIATAFRHYDVVRQLLETDATVDILGLRSPGEEDLPGNMIELISKMESKMEADRITHSIAYCSMAGMSEDVLLYANLNQSDLIVIAPATDLTTKPFYVGPRTYYITQNARIPLLVINKVSTFAVRNRSVPG